MKIPIAASSASAALQKWLPESLLAVYLHGSAVAGGLRPQSDVDLLAVVGKTIGAEARKGLVFDLLSLSGRYPHDAAGRRPLELIVFTLPDLSTPLYPARCDFIYGEWLRQTYEKGTAPSPAADPEYTLVLAQARRDARRLFGPEAAELLPIIPQADIRRAIGDALPMLMDTFSGDERNVLLTLARMWYTLEEDGFTSKDAAAAWAADRLPDEHAKALADARDAYLGLRIDDSGNRQQYLRRTARTLYRCILQSISSRRSQE